MRALLRVPQTSAAQVAQASGYSDQPHWNREFKRLLAMTPGEFTSYVGRFHEQALPIWSDLNRRIAVEPWFDASGSRL
jgi:AraC-like DNA-binding protein